MTDAACPVDEWPAAGGFRPGGATGFEGPVHQAMPKRPWSGASSSRPGWGSPAVRHGRIGGPHQGLISTGSKKPLRYGVLDQCGQLLRRLPRTRFVSSGRMPAGDSAQYGDSVPSAVSRKRVVMIISPAKRKSCDSNAISSRSFHPGSVRRTGLEGVSVLGTLPSGECVMSR